MAVLESRVEHFALRALDILWAMVTTAYLLSLDSSHFNYIGNIAAG